MKLFASVTALALAFALIVPALADDAPKRMTVEQVITIGNGLSALDGYDDTCKDGAVEKPCRRSYHFSGNVRVTIALDLASYRSVAAAYSVVVADLRKQYQPSGETLTPDKQAKFEAELKAALGVESNVTYGRISKGDLKLDDNPIPVSVLSLIMPIIDP